VILVIAGDNDISDKFIAGDKNDKNMGRHGGGELPRIGENRRYLWPSMSDTAADGVIGTAMKSCIHRHPTHLDQKPLRLPKLLQTKTALFSFGDLRGF
jgi:hypothetical protein